MGSERKRTKPRGAPSRRPFRRTEPTSPCRHFGTCGGCDRLDREYAEQLADKHRRLLLELGGLAVRAEVPPVRPSPQVHHYRNKAIYPLQPGPNGTVRSGFYRRGTHELVAIEECWVQEPCLTEALELLRAELEVLGVEPYDETAGTGFARALFGRVATGTGELMLGITTRAGAFDAGAELARRIPRRLSGLRTARGREVRFTGLVRSIHDAVGNRLLGERCVPLRGRDAIEERLGRLSLRISLASFFQVNTGATLVLYDLVRAAIGEARVGRLVDAYAGIGSLALWVGGNAEELWAIESGRSSVRDARENFVRAGRDADRVLEGRVEERLAEVPDPIDVCVVDPPRGGLSPEVREALSARRPPRLVYVSCNPRSFAEDARALAERDWRLERVEGVDLFPHTGHLELVATFAAP